MHWNVLLVCGPLGSCVLCKLQHVLSCLLAWFWAMFSACTFMPSRLLNCSAKIVSVMKYCRFNIGSSCPAVSCEDTDALKFCLSHGEL